MNTEALPDTRPCFRSGPMDSSSQRTATSRRMRFWALQHRYRKEHIPLDAIVQDWYWWKTEGDPIFNSNFPDVLAN